jgi:hypothetical protein
VQSNRVLNFDERRRLGFAAVDAMHAASEILGQSQHLKPGKDFGEAGRSRNRLGE